MSQFNSRAMTRNPLHSLRPARLLPGALLIACLAAVPPARAQLKIEVTSGVTDPVPIAIVPFANPSQVGSGLDVAQVVQHDLEGSGRFRALQRQQMPATPTQ